METGEGVRVRKGVIFWRLAFITVGCVIVAALGLASGAYVRFVQGGKVAGRFQMPFVKPAFEGKDQIMALILGLDERDKLNPKGGQRSDSIMLLQINLADKTVKGLSIPRDSLVTIPGTHRKDKINSAYTVGGADKTMEAVQELTGLKPDYYVVSEVSGFKKVVDLVGGIDLEVEKDMNYDDNWQDLHIHLEQGFQHLNGEKAMEYVRFRHDKFGDITRMQRQQKFLRAVAQRMMALSNLPKLPRIMEAMTGAVHTNMESSDLVYLASTLRHATGDNIKIFTVPGEPKMIGHISYFVPFDKQTKQLVAKTFSLPTSESETPSPGAPTVEVLNGTHQRGLASVFKKTLEEKGYKVVRVANAPSRDNATSLVTYHAGGSDAAERIVGLLGTGESREDSAEVESGTAPSSHGEVTVTLGSDYKGEAVP